jgi:hypothetical protein
MRMITDHNHPIKRNFRSKVWYNREYPCKSPFLMYIYQTINNRAGPLKSVIWGHDLIVSPDCELQRVMSQDSMSIIKYGVPLII